jgi:peptidylprolyl isomerase
MRQSSRWVLISASVGISLLALTGCTTDGGSSAAPKPTETRTPTVVPTSITLPTVTGVSGKAPIIGAPKGAPPTSLVKKDIFVGTGASAAATSTLTVQYTLMSWSTGKIVESSWTGGAPATFPLANVIPGWQQGMPGMKIGGRRLLVIPPVLGYGASGSGPIGPNETLIFVVDVLAIK